MEKMNLSVKKLDFLTKTNKIALKHSQLVNNNPKFLLTKQMNSNYKLSTSSMPRHLNPLTVYL